MNSLCGRAGTVETAISSRVLDEAADWLVKLHSGTVTETDRLACEQWRRISPEHARAWARAETLVGKLGGLPPLLSLPVLNRDRVRDRRNAIRKLALLLAVMPTGWIAWRAGPGRESGADYRTATGEQIRVRLEDGSRIMLNTATAIDVRFDESRREVRLLAGEIHIETAPDTAHRHRDFVVAGAEGELYALGTRFIVRQEAARTHVAVLEGAVEIRPRRSAGAGRIVPAGQQLDFTVSEAGPAIPADADVAAWTQGMLMADKTRLADFLAEVGRYRPGFLRCDPRVADLRVSGAYPVLDTDRTLKMLQATYALRMSAVTPYWVTLSPAD